MTIDSGFTRTELFFGGEAGVRSGLSISIQDLEPLGAPKQTESEAMEALTRNQAASKRGGLVTRVLTPTDNGAQVGYQALAGRSDDPTKGLFGRWRPAWTRPVTGAEVAMLDGLAERVEVGPPLERALPDMGERGNVMGRLKLGRVKEFIAPEHVVAYGPTFGTRDEARDFAIKAAKATGTPMQVWPGDLPVHAKKWDGGVIARGQFQVNQLRGLQTLESAAEGASAVQLKPQKGMAGALVVTASGTPIEVSAQAARRAAVLHNVGTATLIVGGLASFMLIMAACEG